MWQHAIQILSASKAASVAPTNAVNLSRQTAASEVARWLRSNVAVNPELSLRVASSVSASAVESDELKKALVETATTATAATTVDSSASSSLVSALVPVTSTSQQQQLQLLAAASRIASMKGAAAAASSSQSSVARTLFSALNSSASSNKTGNNSAVKAAAAALYARCLAPMFLSASSSSRRGRKQQQDLLDLTTTNLPHDYAEFLRLAKEATKRSDVLPKLKSALDNLPEKRPLSSIYVKCLIQHRMWSDALSFLNNQPQQSSQQQHHVLQSAIAGIHAASGDWRSALEMIPLIYPVDARLKTLNSICKNLVGSSNNYHVRDLIDRCARQLSDEALNAAAPCDEVSARSTGASYALALTLSSQWVQALQDFSLVLYSVAAFKPIDRYDEVARHTLQFDRVARNRVLQAAALGGRADVLKVALRMLATSDTSASSPSSSRLLSRRDAMSLLRILAVEKRNSGILRMLREAWPDERSASLALRCEVGLLARRVVEAPRNSASSSNDFGHDHQRLTAHKFLTAFALLLKRGIVAQPTHGQLAALYRVGMEFPAVMQAVAASNNKGSVIAELFENEKELRQLRHSVLKDLATDDDVKDGAQLLARFCRAQFSAKSYLRVLKQVDSVLSNKKNNNKLISRCAPALWESIADELERIGDKAAPAFLKVVQRVVPVTPTASSGVAGGISIVGELMRVLEKRSNSSSSSASTSTSTKRLGRCIVRLLAVIPLGSLNRLFAGGVGVSSQQLVALVKSHPFPSPPPDALVSRAEILERVFSSSSTQRTNGESNNGEFDQIVQSGWVRGPSDILGLASNTATTRARRQLVMWLLQQSTECRQFVAAEVHRVMAQRQAQRQPFLAPQTIRATLWRQLCDLFECGTEVVVVSSATAAGEDANLVKIHNMSVGRFVVCCADVLRSCSTIVDDKNAATEVLLPFCLEQGLMPHLRRGDTLFAGSFVASACHIEDPRMRLRIVNELRKACENSKNSHASGSNDATAELWRRWATLASAEGLSKLL